jgi:hypothetical protein
MPGDVGTSHVVAAVWPLRLEPKRKLYLLALGETVKHEEAAELACLSSREADEVREYLVDGGLIRSDGNVDVESARTWPDRLD